MTYQTAVFDLDGTLLNTLEDLADAVNYSLKKNKMPLCTITQVCQYVGNGIVKLMERAVPSGKDNPVFEQALSDFKEYYAEHCHDKTALYPGVLALLQNLKKKGVKSAWLSLGGNVCAIGTKPAGSPWRIAVQNPADENDYVGVVEISDACAVTSGGYQRYFEENGKKYHHIIDPATGKPAESGLTSVTIICKDGTKADALSTALYVMGLDDALAYWKTQDDFEVIFVTEEGEVVATEGLKASFTFDGKGNDYTYRVAKR